MSCVEIDKVIERLKDFDKYPEYQRDLDFLINAYSASIYTKNELKRRLKREIESIEQTIKNSPDIGTVKDNSKFGMKIAYQSALNELKELEKYEESTVNEARR